VTTPEPEFGPSDVAWFAALAELEAGEGPHGFLMEDATSPDADPSDPDSAWKFVAGVSVVSPEGQRLRAPVIDFAEKARLDALDKLRGHDVDSMNGVVMPVFRVPRAKRKHRPQPGTTPQQT